jgi:hypothetical protein
MSTPSITLTGAQSEYMYKKTLGVAYEYPGTQPSTESVSSLPYVFNNNIIPYNIPIPAPALDVSSGISGGGTKWTTDVSFIFYYENLPLSINPDTQKYSFVYSSTQSSNVTTHSIPSTYDSLGGTYAISVYDSNNTPVLDTTYIFDNATGCLTFINGPFNPTYSGNPTISFYRYEGPFGVGGGSSQWSTNGDNIYYNTGSVGIGTSNPTRPLDVSGNVRFIGNLDLSGIDLSGNIKFSNNTFQNSAFTGAVNSAGTYTLTNMTLDSNGKITSISNGSVPSNLILNSLSINQATGSSQPSYGWYNNWNTNSSISFTGTGGRTISALNTFCAGLSIRIDSWTATVPPAIASLFEINFTFWNSTSWGQTYCYLQLYPNRLWTNTNNGAYWNINNKINGNNSYNYTDATYAPNGRWYWTYSQLFSGVSSANAWLVPHINYVNINFAIPDNTYSYECNFRCLDATSMTSQNRSWQIYTYNT